VVQAVGTTDDTSDSSSDDEPIKAPTELLVEVNCFIQYDRSMLIAYKLATFYGFKTYSHYCCSVLSFGFFLVIFITFRLFAPLLKFSLMKAYQF